MWVLKKISKIIFYLNHLKHSLTLLNNFGTCYGHHETMMIFANANKIHILFYNEPPDHDNKCMILETGKHLSGKILIYALLSIYLFKVVFN